MILLDTHALVWGLREPDKLSQQAKASLDSSVRKSVSSASLYEIAYKGGLGKWPEISGYLDIDMTAFLLIEGIPVLPVTGAIMQRAGAMAWAHRDPFDRMIVATALAHRVPVISKDVTLDGCGLKGFERIW